jgi:hypothetical protein
MQVSLKGMDPHPDERVAREKSIATQNASTTTNAHQDADQCHCGVNCLARTENSKLSKLMQENGLISIWLLW